MVQQLGLSRCNLLRSAGSFLRLHCLTTLCCIVLGTVGTLLTFPYIVLTHTTVFLVSRVQLSLAKSRGRRDSILVLHRVVEQQLAISPRFMNKRGICRRRLAAGVVAFTGTLWKTRCELVPTTGTRSVLVRATVVLAPFMFAGLSSMTNAPTVMLHFCTTFSRSDLTNETTQLKLAPSLRAPTRLTVLSPTGVVQQSWHVLRTRPTSLLEKLRCCRLTIPRLVHSVGLPLTAIHGGTLTEKCALFRTTIHELTCLNRRMRI